MDKYEFNIKVEQIKKLVTKGDFTTSMKIADTIDWRRVRNTNLLAMISQVYEKNGEYQEAKEILMQAYERAPVSKRLLFKLAELALREGNIREAEEYYREFNEAAPGDPRQHLLKYLILKAKGVSGRQLVSALQNYVATELDERWMYELAELYAAVGERERCVQMCDKIALMFAFGKYVDKALALKAQFAELSDYQQDLVQNPDKYEAQYKAVEQEFANGALDVFGDDDQESEDHFSATMQFPDRDYEEEPYHEEDAYDSADESEDYEAQAYEEPEYADGYDISKEDVQETEEAGYEEPTDSHSSGRVTIDEELVANLHQAAAEEQLAREMSKITQDGVEDKDILNEQTKKLYDINRALPPALQMEEEEAETPDADVPEETEEGETEEEAEMPPVPRYMAIETRTPEKGIEKAIEKLKAYHLQNNSHNQTVKIKGSRLNSRGMDALSDQLTGRDLIVDEAGDLSGEELEKIVDLMTAEDGNTVVALLDNPRQMEDLYQKYPELMDRFARIDGELAAGQDVIGDAVVRKDDEEERPAGTEETDALAEEVSQEDDAQAEAEEPARDSDYHQEMDLEAFAQYACDYAAEIDCSITGKSMLALYERVELMEEDGIPLTKENAEAMIEEAADKAEKPSLGRLITGVFSAKYDKEGLLILREEHFK